MKNLSEKIPYGYCRCGCGAKTNPCRENYKKLNLKKGDPHKFIVGHNMRGQPGFMTGKLGEKSPRWNGGRVIDKDGYIFLRMPNHPKAKSNGYILEAYLLIEKILGKQIHQDVVIHHTDGNPSNNSNINLVACENQAYHMLLHRRQRAFDACGNAGWRKCVYCKKYDDVQNIVSVKNGNYHHVECRNKYRKERRLKLAKKGLSKSAIRLMC